MVGKHVAILLGCLVWAATATAPAAERPDAAARNHALLVGCSAYPHLDVPPLAGSANDVVLLRRLLVERFGFLPANVTVLAEADPAARPTRANIERHFARLAEVAGQDSQVVILMSGHGTQVPAPDPTDPNNFEPDALDEVFLCADAREFDPDTASLPGAIVDNELGDWVRRIRDGGAQVWIIVDCCHSGTIIRGARDNREVVRRVPIERVVPRGTLEALRDRQAKRSTSTRSGGASPPDAPLSGELKNIAALYAAQPEQSTIELPLPPDTDAPTNYGLLTYTVCEVLTQAGAPLTYRELAQRVSAAYLRDGRSSPTPFLEGENRDREVLGLRQWPRRSSVRVVEPGRINAGSLHGLTRGSILKVLPPDATPTTQPVGYAEITRPESLASDVQPIEYRGLPPAALPVGARCEIEFVDFGLQRLRVAADLEGAEQRERVVQALRVLDAQHKLVERVAEPAAADWVVRAENGQLYIEPASGQEALDPAATPRFGPVPGDATLESWLAEHLAQLARGGNLLAMARPRAVDAVSKDACRVKFELVRLRDKGDREGEPIDWQANGIALGPGQLVGCRLENVGEAPADVTLLFVDSGYGVTAVFPRAGVQTDNRLYPGDKPFLAFRGVVDDKTIGLEHLVLIAVPGEGDGVDFSVLEQPTLPRARSQGGRALGSPLGQLLQQALYGEGGSRGTSAGEIRREQVEFLSWRVRGKDEG